MFLRYRTEGFVFKGEDRGEADRMFSVFTKNFGRLEIFGKSIRKINSKLRGGMEIFSLSEIEFIQGRHRKTLVETFSLERFNPIKEDIRRFQVALHVSDLLDRFLKGEEKDESLWGILREVWEKLSEESLSAEKQTLLYYYFLWNFTVLLGYKPELVRCAGCSGELDPAFLYFSFQEGGVLCQSCFSALKGGIRVRSEVVKLLRLMIRRKWEMLSRIKVLGSMQDGLQAISEQYISYLSEHAVAVNIV